jgi:hypothetical protein
MFVFPLRSPIDGDGGDDGGGGGEAAPTMSPFEQAMQNVGREAEAQLQVAAQETPPGEGTPAAQPTMPPAGAAAPAAQPAASPQYLTFEQGRALAQQWQMQQQQLLAMQQLLARNQQPAAPAPKPEPERYSTQKLVETFREPQRQANETPEQFETRRTALLLDHLHTGAIEHATRQAEAKIEERWQRWQQQQQQAVAQAEGERAFNAALDESVTKGGFAAGTPVAQYVRELAYDRLVARSSRGETAQWSDAQWKHAMSQEIALAKQFLGGTPAVAPAPAPAAGAKPAAPAPAGGDQPRGPDGKFAPKDAATAPATPPISGGNKSNPSAPPPNVEAKRASSFDEAMRQVHSRALREVGEA